MSIDKRTKNLQFTATTHSEKTPLNTEQPKPPPSAIPIDNNKQNGLEKEFAPYEEAIELYKLGFDEWCFSFYHRGQLYNSEGYYKKGDNVFPTDEVVAPTYSQAFRWFRDKYIIRQNIMDFIDDETGIEWDYEIAIIGTELDERGNYKPLVDYSIDDENRKFKTYEEAELACLRKLIEIVKEKNK